MTLRILIVIAAIVAIVLVFAARRPDRFHVERSISIQAPPEKVFALINDFHNWPLWAPQDKEDASMKRTFSGAESGVGAVSDWSSRGSAGQGRMSIVESEPATWILVKVDFTKPFEAHNLNGFTLGVHGTSTTVTWSMVGTNLFFMKVMSVFVNMDKIAGKHFEDGLANLKVAAER
jgi:uncharacterized protein YndB with AHSA1/START domain